MQSLCCELLTCCDPKASICICHSQLSVRKGIFFKSKSILISQVELHVLAVPVAPAAFEMKVMDPVVPFEYKSDTMNLMPQPSKQCVPLCHPLAWQGTYVGGSHRLFCISQLLRKEAAIFIYTGFCCSLLHCSDVLKWAQNRTQENGRKIRSYFSRKPDDCPPE